VKLAYNEEDDTKYVSISTTESKFIYLELYFMKICIYLWMYVFIYLLFLLLRMRTGFWYEYPWGKDCNEDLSIDGKIFFKYTFKN
jgi:hypothetical protein